MGRGRSNQGLLGGRDRLQIAAARRLRGSGALPPLPGLSSLGELLEIERIKAEGQATNTASGFAVDLKDLSEGASWPFVGLPGHELSVAVERQWVYSFHRPSKDGMISIGFKAGELLDLRHRDQASVFINGSWRSWPDALLACPGIGENS